MKLWQKSRFWNRSLMTLFLIWIDLSALFLTQTMVRDSSMVYKYAPNFPMQLWCTSAEVKPHFSCLKNCSNNNSLLNKLLRTKSNWGRSLYVLIGVYKTLQWDYMSQIIVWTWHNYGETWAWNMNIPVLLFLWG